MSSFKLGCVFLFALTFTAFNAQAADTLNGYTPPPMFAAPTSKPASPEPVAPAAPAAKEFYKITTPPADKEKIVRDEPLPIEPIHPKTPQKVTTVPSDKESVPKYVPPVKKAEKIQAKPPAPSAPAVSDNKKIELPVIQPKEPEAAVVIPTAKLQPGPVIKNIAPGLKAEDLLSHPVTSGGDAAPMPENPLAVPAAPVENGLPLPGSVKAQPKVKLAKKDIKQEEKKADKKKPDVKKAEPKKEKPAEKKKEKKVEKKKAPEKKAEVKKEAPKKLETPKPVKLEEPKAKPAEKPVAKQPYEDPYAKAKAHAVENTKINSKPFHLEGKKNMPVVKPTKVDSVTLEKLPLPKIDPVAPVAEPTLNEKMIDESLKDHLVEPDVSKIATPADKKSDKAAPSKVGTVTAAKKVAPEAKPEKIVKPQLISLEFKKDQSEIQPDQKKIVDADILSKLKTDPAARLQILAYASPSKEGQSSARRVSLTRGLSLRSYLLEKGIDPSRIDIRALGENTEEKPLDRVDLLVVPSK